jgi:hypothetical protein
VSGKTIILIVLLALLLGWVLVSQPFSASSSAPAAGPPMRLTASKPVGNRVLFIGNSYTSCIQKQLADALASSPYKRTTFEFITPGGRRLKQHLDNPATLKRIRTGNWDAVVLQDQSQTPALPGKPSQSFHASVDALTKHIRRAGAKPVLYMTWGRRHGDPRNKTLFPDYDSMQKKLTAAYRAAAKRNKIDLAPVGDVWAIVRKTDPALGNKLYAKDDSHPSSHGAYLASCVFFRALFDDSLETMPTAGGLTEAEAGKLKNIALNNSGPSRNTPAAKTDK